MASLVSRSALGKVDLILRRDDSWGRSAMRRRQRWTHPEFGPAWIASLEDLVLPKLEWSEGRSELQLRDCRNLITVNRRTIDRAYLDRYAANLGLTELLHRGCGMRPDPGRALMDQQISRTTPEARVEWSVRLRQRGLQLVCQLSDEAGPMDELERATFILDRLYPDMPAEHRRQIDADLAAHFAAGTWHGFQRPQPPQE
ncbi:hypothetical protein BH20CHL6_BH20CHL6_17540 [soil metagenome]